MLIPARRRALRMIGGAAAVLSACKPAVNLPVQSVTLAVPYQLSAGAAYLAQADGVFQRSAVNVTMQRFVLGKQALESVVKGTADLALVADTPFVLAVLREQPVRILATVFASRTSMACVARADRGIRDESELAGKTVGTVLGTNAQYFLDSMLVAQGVSQSSVAIRDLAPERLIPALENAEVDAVTLWHPFLARAQAGIRVPTVILAGEDVFIYRFLLVAKARYIEEHGEAASRVLRGLIEATELIRANPERARALIGAMAELDDDVMRRAFAPGDFTVSLDQPLLLTLSDQARWAMARSISPAVAMPNFLHSVDQSPLRRIAPSAITIIR